MRTVEKLKMKKLLMALALMPLMALANTWTDESTGYTWYYNVSGGKAEIRNSYSCAVSPEPSGALTIPSQIEGYPVVSIGKYAFEYCSGLTSVTIPEGVTSIGDSAFYDCSGLMSVTVPPSVKSVGSYAFSWCSGLVRVDISDLASWCGIEFDDYKVNPLYYAGHLYVNGEEIKDLVIPDGVEGIGDYAFYGCSGLTSVTIPSSVKSIGYEAFYDCSGLTRVEISDLTMWCGIQFGGYSSNPLYYAGHLYVNGKEVKDLVVPDGVEIIRNLVFEGCDGLTSVTIPSGVMSIGDYAFSGCSGLTRVEISDLTMWCGIQFGGYSSNPLSYAGHLYVNGKEVKDLVVPDGVKNIGDCAFYRCSGLTSVTIPSSVKSVGSSSFSWCSGLTSVTLPEGVTSISDSVFYGCSGLTSVAIPSSVTSVGGHAFYGCSGLTSVTIPSRVTSIGDYAFYGCSGLTSVTIPLSVTSIGYGSFSNCSGLTRVDVSDLAAWCGIEFGDCDSNPLCYAKHLYANGKEVKDLVVPDGVKNIGDCAFYGCSGLMSVTIPEGVTSIGSSAFNGCSGLMSVTIPSSVERMGNDTFRGCSGLTSVTIPEGVTSIGSSAFNGCSGLTSVMIPSSVTSIGDYAFYNCNGLGGVYIQDLAAWCSIDFYGLYSNPLSYANALYLNGVEVTGSLSVPDGVESIADRAFYGCRGLTSVTIPEGVKSIGYEAFSCCSGLISVTIPSSMESIGSSAFSGCSKLTSVTIPSSVTYIASSAFDGCRALAAINVDLSNLYYSSLDGVLYDKIAQRLVICPNGKRGVLTIPASVTEIPYRALIGCVGLTFINVEEGNSAYCSKNGLLCSGDGRTIIACPGGITDLILPDGVSATDYRVFAECRGPLHVTVPSSMATIPNSAFYDCSNLVEVTIQNGVVRIGESAFRGCARLTSINVPKSVQSIGRYAFEGCGGLTDITLPFIGTQRGSGERFYSIFGYSSDVPEDLTTVTITDETSVPNYAFEGCENIRSVNLPIGVSSIGDSAFRGCKSLNAISLPAGIAKIGSSAFYGCSSLSEVVIPVGVSSIESSTFYDCTSLRKVTLPVGLMEIGGSAFRNCRNLYQINIPNTVTSIGFGAFDGCTGLGSGVVVVDNCLLTVNEDCPETVVIGKDVRLIVGGAFSECENLQSVTINAQIEVLPDDLFEYCSNLKKVVLPTSLRVIGGWAFCGCHSLEDIQLPDGLVEIQEGAFNGCASIRSFNIPASMTELWSLPTGWYDDWDEEVFIPSKLAKLTVASGNKVYASYDNVLYSKDGRILLYCLPSVSSVAIRKGTKFITYGAFQGCTKLTDLTLPEGVVAMGDLWEWLDDDWPSFDFTDGGPFDGCVALRSISLPSTIEYIYMGKPPSLTKLSVAAGNKHYFASDNVLYDKKNNRLIYCLPSMKSVKIWEKTESIASYAFEGCAKIESLTIPASVKKIGTSPFLGCEKLKAVYYKGDAPFPLLYEHTCATPWYSWEEVDEEDAADIQDEWKLYVLSSYWPGHCSAEPEYEFLDVTSYVQKGTKWWGDSGEWQGRPLVFVDSIENPMVKYSVSFDPCGGESTLDHVEIESGKTVGTLPTPTRSKYKFLGWYTAEKGGTKISSTTKVTGDTTYYAHWQYDGLSLVSAKVVADCVGMGSASGGKRAKAGTKVTLKATAKKGYAFAGWYLGGELMSKAASYSFKTTDEDVDYQARFVTLAEDKASVRATANGMAFAASGTDKLTLLSTNVMCGVALFWPLSHEALSATSVKVTGLPKGLKYDTKKKAITGVPTAPGKTSSVKIAVTTAGKQTVTFTLKVAVVALPEWAKGQFTGAVDGHALTMSVGSTGKVSGKFKDGITNWTFSVSSFATNSVTVGETNLFCRATAKGTYKNAKKKTVTVSAPIVFTLVAAPDVSPIAAEGLGDFAGETDNVEIWRVAAAKLSVNDAKGGTVKTDKSYGQAAAGVKVKFTATLKKGYTLLGWYDEVTGELLSQKTSFSLVSDGVTDRFVEARFAKEADLSAADFALGWDGLTNLTVGVAYSAQLTVSGEAAVKIASVSGLPKGLSYKSGKVSGVATTAKTNTVSVTFALATNAKKKFTLKQTLVVEPLPDWACDTFTGDIGTEDEPIPVTVTVASSGKVSGKYKLSGATWTFSEKSLSSAAYDAETGEPVSFAANVTATATISKKKKSQKLVVTVTEEGADILNE